MFVVSDEGEVQGSDDVAACGATLLPATTTTTTTTTTTAAADAATTTTAAATAAVAGPRRIDGREARPRTASDRGATAARESTVDVCRFWGMSARRKRRGTPERGRRDDGGRQCVRREERLIRHGRISYLAASEVCVEQCTRDDWPLCGYTRWLHSAAVVHLQQLDCVVVRTRNEALLDVRLLRCFPMDAGISDGHRAVFLVGCVCVFARAAVTCK